jgi:hypothetical protein
MAEAVRRHQARVVQAGKMNTADVDVGAWW